MKKNDDRWLQGLMLDQRIKDRTQFPTFGRFMPLECAKEHGATVIAIRLAFYIRVTDIIEP